MGAKISLAKGWAIQSSADVAWGGEVISTPGWQPEGWHPASVPTTVLAALVKNHVYPDPTFGTNLREIPGATYPVGENFSNLPMPPGSPFAVPFWYRTEFRLPRGHAGEQIWLELSGINYSANLWLNGRQIADRRTIVGALLCHELNITEVARPGRANALAVEVFPPAPEDLAITFIDWNPLPPDKDMGLWQGVYVTSSGPVALRHPHVITRVDLPSRSRAHLTITAELHNATDRPISGILKARIEDIHRSLPVDLGPRETREVELPPIHLARPRLWWPAQMGRPHLRDLHLAFEVDGALSDQRHVRFGIREVTSALTDQGARLFRVNGERILVRGGGWTPDLMLREDPRRLEAELRYVRDLGLNTLRLEGKFPGDRFFDLADRRGVLIMAGFACCDAWEKWPLWPEQNLAIAAASLRDQIRRLRNHPSLFVWLNGSDNPPPPAVEKTYLEVLAQCRLSLPSLSSATAQPSAVTGPTGVKMSGPYAYVAPSYWLDDRAPGGASGFNTETSPGAAIPVVESLRKFLPEQSLWPMDETFRFHAGGGVFKDIQTFNDALAARYGDPSGLADYNEKAQLMAYEGIRAMFEAYGRNKYRSTGVIQWMLNNAWPSVIWHLYDYHLQPAGGYFGAKKACEPLHAQYGYDDRSISLVSSLYTEQRGLTVTAQVLDLDLDERFSRRLSVDAPPDSSQKLLDLPGCKGLSPTYFLRLTVDDARGRRRSDNLYWLSTKPETFAWERSTWYSTPIASYADFTALGRLPRARLNVAMRAERRGAEEITRVTVENPGRALAFFLRLQLTRGRGGAEVLPVIYQDNYFSLFPGERRDLLARVRRRDLAGASPAVLVSGWNVAPVVAG